MKKTTNLIIALLLSSFLSQSAWAQNSGTEVIGGNGAYSVNIPTGWQAEHGLLPSKLASSNKGGEVLLFSAGWNDSQSEQYWTFSSVWYLDGPHSTDEETIKQGLTTYFTELTEKNIGQYKIPAQKILPVKTWIRELQNEGGDAKTYYGAVAMLDYKSKLPISLNCIVHVRPNPDGNGTVLFFELSPKEMSDPVWSTLEQVSADFKWTTNQYSTN